MIKLGLHDKPGKHDLAEAVKLYGRFRTLFFIFFITFQAYFTSFSFFLFFSSCFASSARLSFALWVQMSLRCPFTALLWALLARSTHQFHRPLCAWVTDVWGREENRCRYSQHPAVDWWPSGATAGQLGPGGRCGKGNHAPPLQSPGSTQFCLPSSSLLSVRRLFQPANSSLHATKLWSPEPFNA